MQLILQNVKYLLLIADYLKDEATPYLYNFYYEHHNKAFLTETKTARNPRRFSICVWLMSPFVFKNIYK